MRYRGENIQEVYAQRDELLSALRDFHVLVKGEAPSLLEDSMTAQRVETLLTQANPSGVK